MANSGMQAQDSEARTDTQAKPVALAIAGAHPPTDPSGARTAAPVQASQAVVHYPVAGPSRRRGRHWLVIFSFLFLVLGPSVAAGWYLWQRAADQFASRVAFSVRTEDNGSAIEMLGGITEISGSSSSDTDILYDFLQSQSLVVSVDAALDLREIWGRAGASVDPVFAFHAPGSIETLQRHWDRMVRIAYDTATGLIDIRVLAFDPRDAQAIALQIQEQSSMMINDLSAVARRDAIGYARAELSQSEARLADARLSMTEFRTRTQIVDPALDTQGQMGLVTTLQAQLAEALIDLDVLRETTRDSDPRLAQAERRIAVIEERIEAERAQLGTGRDGSGYAELVAEYETLSVDQEFAQQAYIAALAAFDLARNEAQRQSRYLAAHIAPSLSETAQYPQRIMLLTLIIGFLFLTWATLVLLGYALRDRR